MNTEKTSVQWIEIIDDIAGQRIDNFLLNQLKNIPKSAIYRLLRKGEVRVNKKRIKPEYKLQIGDVVRVPPVAMPEKREKSAISAMLKSVAHLNQCVVYEDDHLLIINKPSGMAVHGGSGLHFGVIEAMRALRPDARFLELVHRIDRDTSGLLLIAKKRSALRHLQAQFREKKIQKYYLALVAGQWSPNTRKITAPLLKNEENSIVRVNSKGKPSETRFKVIESFAKATLLQASPITGRTHQIRVHCQYAGHSIALDERYGDADFDLYMRKIGLQRLFLHAANIKFTHPATEQMMNISAEIGHELKKVLSAL